MACSVSSLWILAHGCQLTTESAPRARSRSRLVGYFAVARMSEGAVVYVAHMQSFCSSRRCWCSPEPPRDRLRRRAAAFSAETRAGVDVERNQ
jgi:hypothetical protein